jgi:heme-degrading monooxygenase HmoA
MIARLWKGQTTSDDADAYEQVFRSEVVTELQGVPGYRGAYLLRRGLPDGVEFAALTLFDSLEAVRAFARGRLRGRRDLPGRPARPRPIRPDLPALRGRPCTRRRSAVTAGSISTQGGVSTMRKPDLNKTAEGDAYMTKLEHPFKAEVQAMIGGLVQQWVRAMDRSA